MFMTNILYCQEYGGYARYSTNTMLPDQSNDISFHKGEIGVYADFGYSRNFVGAMGGIQIYSFQYIDDYLGPSTGYKLVMPVMGTYTHYLRNYSKSLFIKVGFGFSLPGLFVDWAASTITEFRFRINGFTAIAEIGYRFPLMEPDRFHLALGFDLQQVRTVHEKYSSISKHLVFMGPSISIRANIYNE